MSGDKVYDLRLHLSHVTKALNIDEMSELINQTIWYVITIQTLRLHNWTKELK